MKVIRAASADDLLCQAAQDILSEGVHRQTRGFECIEFPTPVCLILTEPARRWITVPARKWGKYLPLVESLWLASGRNDLATVAYYLKRMSDFSDDNLFCRAAYGPRLRRYNGALQQYQESAIAPTVAQSATSIDQLAYVVQCFETDPHTRQATINIGDPIKDAFTLNADGTSFTTEKLKTVDYPCTRGLQFIANKDKLDLVVNMRSNDLIWGAFGVNIFNFTWMQEYMAQVLNLKVGTYYHIAANLHYYSQESFTDIVRNIAAHQPDSYENWYYPTTSFQGDLSQFDTLVKELSALELKWRNEQKATLTPALAADPFFSDWGNMIGQYHLNKKYPDLKLKAQNFHNPNVASMYGK